MKSKAPVTLRAAGASYFNQRIHLLQMIRARASPPSEICDNTEHASDAAGGFSI